MLIKNALLSVLTSLLKSLLTLKKICLLTGLLATAYYVKTKFFKRTLKTEVRTEKNAQSIINTIETPLPIELKVGLFCCFQKRYRVPDDVIKKIFFIYEATTTRKNLLFLSFYQDGFIGPGDGWLLESSPPHFPDCKKITLDSNLTATFYPANPFVKKSEDEIIIEESRTEQIITIGPQENAFIAQIYAEVVKILPHFQYETLQECQVINNIFYTIHTCKSIDQIEKASQQLLKIQSEQLQSLLFQQLKITAYRFWNVLEWDNTQKTACALFKIDTILVHPHFFNWHINNNLTEKNIVMNSNEFYTLFNSKGRSRTFKEKLLEESACSFVIYMDHNHNYVKYPHPFLIIEKDHEPLRMH